MALSRMQKIVEDSRPRCTVARCHRAEVTFFTTSWQLPRPYPAIDSVLRSFSLPRRDQRFPTARASSNRMQSGTGAVFFDSSWKTLLGGSLTIEILPYLVAYLIQDNTERTMLQLDLLSMTRQWFIPEYFESSVKTILKFEFCILKNFSSPSSLSIFTLSVATSFDTFLIVNESLITRGYIGRVLSMLERRFIGSIYREPFAIPSVSFQRRGNWIRVAADSLNASRATLPR